MESAPLLYADSPTAQCISPWIRLHLPTLHPVVQHRLIQLTTGLMETVDVRVEQLPSVLP
ncbi:hypothetical protein [Herpetosiphon llansteffanensis]|uniref:hypothetical protein n=1 Tax=Herpetosiphon llansteffanensis TaxID=2094568 RepID=UPI000D7C9A4B|nr:hypothetical protein [Herpetosiphon llansteffanensis]